MAFFIIDFNDEIRQIEEGFYGVLSSESQTLQFARKNNIRLVSQFRKWTQPDITTLSRR